MFKGRGCDASLSQVRTPSLSVVAAIMSTIRLAVTAIDEICNNYGE